MAEFCLGLTLGICAAFLFMFAAGGGPSHDPRVAQRVICQYLEGEQQGDVCIKDGKVVKIDLSNFRDN